MAKFRLLLLDADVVIQLFRLGLWDQIVERCEVHVSRTVAETEADFYMSADGFPQEIDLGPYEEDARITVFDVVPSERDRFRGTFDPSYFDRLDPGETESLIYMLNAGPGCRVCSADKIVFRVLGNLRRGHGGVSLEEVLEAVGLGRTLPEQFTRAYRDKWTTSGFADSMWDIGYTGPDEE